MLQKILFIFIVLVIFVSGYLYFSRENTVEADESSIPSAPIENVWADCGEDINLIQFDSSYTQTQKVIIKTNLGNIKMVLYPEKAPKACENFLALSKEGFYNGLKFTKIIEDYFIQAGDPQDGTGGRSIWNKPFPNEISVELWNFRGAVGMASTEKNKNGSQFYIINAKAPDEKAVAAMEKSAFPQKVIEKYKSVGGAPWLDGKHTVFGYVTEGLDVVEKIMQNKNGIEPAIIEEIIAE